MTSTGRSDPLVRGVDDVLITRELASRPSPSPDYEAESRALGLLAKEMATNSRGVLQKCAELVMELCRADSAGISILEPGGTSGMLRWHAAAGAFSPNLHGTMPQEASPCGTVIERNCVLLFHEAERFFPALRGFEPRIYENLLAPWQVKGKAVGTLWAISHTPEGRFDEEDARVLQSLASFAAAAFQMTLALDEAAAERSEIRASQERQAFLLKLSDALRAEPTADAIGMLAVQSLADHLSLDRCYIVSRRQGGNLWDVRPEVRSPGLPAMPPVLDEGEFPEALRLIRDQTLAIDDTAARTDFNETEKQGLQALGFGGLLMATLRTGKRNPAWAMVAASTLPRRWTWGDIQLVENVAERTWAAMKRARTELMLRESEERFQQFADASAAGLWIRTADTLAMEFVSPAVGAIYGVEADALLGDVARWAGMIVPDDRDVALGHLEAARRGEAVVHEFRIRRPSDGEFRWIRNTDFPLRDDGRIPRIGGIAEDVTEAKLAAEHSAVLLAELQHRVRNIMALLRSITNRTADRAESVPEYQSLMMGRLLAFARVQALLTRAANVSVGIASIVHDEVSVQAQHEGQYVLDGPDIALSPKAAEVLTLAIHELATNAVKYGALSVPDGKVTVRWSTFEKRGGAWLAFDWIEEGAPARPQPTPDALRRRGFGSELIEGRIPYELQGRGQITIEPGGARCHLEFPLQGGASILETGTPQRATVFGGAIDMTGEPDLTGRRVLVVEDDYYLATDAARALRGAGAEVMGPCATEEDARAELEEQRPDAVVVDINLGPGPSFKLAEALKDRGIPFVFTTGYDAEVIPAEFDGVERLEKPLQLRQIVGAVAKLTAAA